MITFVDYLYKEIGGVGQLVINTVVALNSKGLKAKVYCSTDSYEYKGLVANHATFIHIDSDIVALNKLVDYIDKEDVILLTHINNTPLLEAIKHLGNRILFYSVHPDTFFVYNHFLDKVCSQKKNALKLIKKLESKNALIFMDYPNVEGVIKRGGKIDYEKIKYLPIPVPSCNKCRDKKVKSGVIHITYMGRGNADWKIYPIIRILKDLQSTPQNLRLTIITDKTDSFQSMIKDLVPSNTVEIEYETDLYGDRLQRYLIDNSDLHFAMGTSALEAAKLGIPTILVDLSYKEFPDSYRYKWMYESKGYSLANNITNETSFVGLSIKEVIEDVNNTIKYSNHSELCYEYVKANHFIESYLDNLLKYVDYTEMTVADYCITGFSRNMKNIMPLILNIGKIKRFILCKQNN